VLQGVAARFDWHDKVAKLTKEITAIRAEKTITNLSPHKSSHNGKKNLPPCANSMLPPK